MSHHERILDQFTRQAIPFSTAPGIRDTHALAHMVEVSQASTNDTLLDVACGPGIVACAFAPHVKHVTGIDITPAMLQQASALQQRLNLTNLTWQQGNVQQLPFDDASFDIVTCRFSFHHFEDPFAVLCEMKRVCKPTGRIVVADSAPVANKAAAFNAMEKLRDPSHVRAMPIEELKELFHRAGLQVQHEEILRLATELEGLLQRSFPLPGDKEKIRPIFEASLQDDALDMQTRREDGRIVLTYPVALLRGAKK